MDADGTCPPAGRSGCAGCTCRRPEPAPASGRLLLATRVGHTSTLLRSLALRQGLAVTSFAPGVLEVTGHDAVGLLRLALAELSGPEAEEVRALTVPGDVGPRELTALALAAPPLSRAGARLANAALLPLFADERTGFRSVYQPIVDLGDGSVVGHEALLRGNGPDGEVTPDRLFRAAAQAGWTHVLDRIGRTTALHGAAGWLGADQLFINFMPTTIYRPEVCLRTTELAAEQAGVRLEQLVFEVTEGEQVSDIDHLERVFAYYRHRGCKVALDDLGSGYSSLTLLVRLQPDVVKLDKELVQALPGAAAAAVVQAIVDMTHAYGGTVLAECVETREQADSARGLGVDLGQGWLFGRPCARQAAAATGIPDQRNAVLDPSRPDPAVALPQPAA